MNEIVPSRAAVGHDTLAVIVSGAATASLVAMSSGSGQFFTIAAKLVAAAVTGA